MPPTKTPEKPTLRAVETTPAPRVHPLFPALRSYPSQVRVYRMDRDGSTELLETMSAADLDPGVEPLGVCQTLARAALRASWGPGVYRVQALSEGGGVLGGPQRVVIGESEDEQRAHQPAPRAVAPSGASPLQQSVDAAVTTTTARGLVDELRASASRSADASNNQVAAMAAMMQTQMQSQATLFGTVLQSIAGQQNRGTDPVLLEILRERGDSVQKLREENARLRDDLHELRRTQAVENVKGSDLVTRKMLEIGENFALAMAKSADEKRLAQREHAQALPPPPSDAPAQAPKPPTLLDAIDAHAPVDPSAVDLETIRAALDRASRDELVAGDAAYVLVAGVLARDGALPAELHPALTRALLKLGATRVRSR